MRHGAAALELIGQIQPDLMLLDLRMPMTEILRTLEQQLGAIG